MDYLHWLLTDLTSTEKIESNGLVESDQDKKTMNADVESIEPVTRPVVDGMVCYGIGSFEESRNAQFQLSLALELRDLLEVKHKICIFDPVMTDLDKEIAKALDMQVLDKGEDLPAYTVNGTILYFMPHCPKGLYSNILEKNWTRLRLDRTVILGNRFSMYHESPNYKTIAKQAPFIFAALPIAEEYALPTIKFEENTAFNDLAIHVFPPHFKLPEPDVTEREIDPELL
ncbi:hypothetical protein BGW42_001963 [Actinomortierella wolfii]|nr:hypothetical protein BGW42_001963 [Actinomortierella wolfii]